METLKFAIVDKTTNSEKFWINAFGDNCEMIDNAELYDSSEDAQYIIDSNDWNSWAEIKEVTPEMI